MHKAKLNNEKFTNEIPHELLKSATVEVRVKGKWQKVASVDKNMFRLMKFHFDQVKADAIRFTAKETYGVDVAKLFEIRAYEV